MRLKGWETLFCNNKRPLASLVHLHLTVRFLGDKFGESEFFHGGISQDGRIRRLTATIHHGCLKNRQEPSGGTRC